MKNFERQGPEKIEGPTIDETLLFATANGWVRYCGCHDVLVLHYADHWMAFTRAQYRDFHARLISTVRCPNGQRQLNSGGRFAFRSRDVGEPAFFLDRGGMEDLLWLLDSSRYMLEARDAAQRGFSEAITSDQGRWSLRNQREKASEEC
jgi:hypothetical protein